MRSPPAPPPDTPQQNFKVLGVVPERRWLQRDVLGAIGSQFWNQGSQSTSAIDGLTTTAPGEPTPLPLCTPSGLSRNQLLVAAQAVTLPGLPSICSNDGGVVADRVLFHTGSESWWATVSGRAKVQRILAQKRERGWKQALLEPNNYTLCANARALLGPKTIVKGRMELMQVKRMSVGTRAASASTPLASGLASMLPPWLQGHTVSGHAQLKHRLGQAEVRAEAGLNQRLVDNARGYTLAPLTASLDIATPQGQTSAVQYRAGVLHVTAPPTVSTDSSSPSATSTSCTHLQGALALQGERTLWAGNAALRTARLRKRLQRNGVVQHAPSTRAPPPITTSTMPTTLSSSLRPAGGDGASAGGLPKASQPLRSKTLGPHNPIRQYLKKLLPVHGVGHASDEEGGVSGEAGIRHGGGHTHVGATTLPEPEQVQEAVMDSTQSINRLREDVQSLTDWVSSGGFSQQLLARIGSKPLTGSRSSSSSSSSNASSSATRAPWSSIVGPPHIKVAGVVGAVVRSPLWPLTPNGHGGRTSVGSTSRATAVAAVEQQQAAHVTRTASMGLRQDLVRTSFDWLTSNLTHAKEDVTVRPFASLGASVQMGWFQRSMFDFTRVTTKLDLGLPAPKQLVPGSAPQVSSHPAFSLNGRGCWHALTMSVSQQLIGPLRVCADFRYCLESKQPWQPAAGTAAISQPAAAAARTTAQSRQQAMARQQSIAVERAQHLARHVKGMRPSLLDAAYGLDLALPGTAGFGRMVAWVAPGRGEAMLELRLF